MHHSPTQPLPVLFTQRLILRLPEIEEAPTMAAYWAANLEHFNRFNPARGQESTTHTYWLAQLARNIEEASLGRSLRLSMYLRDAPQGAMIGDCNLSNFERGAAQCCRMGYKLDQRHVGQGYMTEAVIAVCTHAFEVMNMHRVEANHMVGNDASQRVLRRAGFVVEGYSRDYLFVGGQWRDHVRCALTNPRPTPPCARAIT